MRTMRAVATVAIGCAAGLFGAVTVEGLGGCWPLALLGFLAVGAAVGSWVWRGRLGTFVPDQCPRALKIGSLIATIVGLVQLARLAVFIIDPTQVNASILPSSEWERRHSCVSSYYVAAEAIDRTPNVYDDALYSIANPDPAAPRKPRLLDGFRVDVYEYPTPFLLLPRAVDVAASDFLHFRSIWFGLNGSAALLALLAVASLLAPAVRTRALLYAPLVFAAFPFGSVLQKGNAQILVIALAMLAMVLFDRRRYALGGVLLAFAMVSKLYPGMLVVYLLARRDWRAVGWTIAWSMALVVASILDTGWAPLAAFLAHLPRLLGGEAFPAFKNPAAVAINYSIPGLVLKLKLFGVPAMSFAISKLVGWVYTLAVVATTIVLARREREATRVTVWLAILILATLRSPFLPQAYAGYPPVWLLTLLAAMAVPSPRVLALVLATWLGLNIFVAMDWSIDPRWMSLIVAVPQTIAIALTIRALYAEDVSAHPPRINKEKFHG
ncbi:MAG: glycosyltransferase family 87 protein [Deltaproteobacteria bacterium]